ncbi:MAG: hypothetical protein ICV62_13880 [Cyanobacteria bacterium Co-bin13]|nr:hypothetical protein [Cyanobacteria bacterium Co-bin13]
MPGGKASHKGSSDKPNVNAAGIVGEASDPSTAPQEELPEVMMNNAAHRAEEAEVYPPAVERPHEGDSSED